MLVHHHLEHAAADAIHGLALGFFDGVHPGHQRVFQAIIELGQPLSVLTFWPHPQAVLRPQTAPALITGLPHKLELFRRAGARQVIVQPFDPAFARLSAEDFLDLLFRNLPRLRAVACGPNFHFGHGRQGDQAMLAAAAARRGLAAATPGLVPWEGQPLSSSRIRAALAAGDLRAATAMLSRPYRLRGTVVPGRRLGRTLGFPTANLDTGDGLLLPAGVYAGLAHLPDGSSRRAAINLGPQPTIDPRAPAAVEAHLLDFSGELEGTEIEIEPRRFLRPQRHFAGLEELRAAIAADVRACAD